MPLHWNIHYFRWVIDDGEPELHVGDVFHWFAVSFWSDEPLAFSVETTKAAVPLADGLYRVIAEVTYVSQDAEQAACILDFGLSAVAWGVSLLPQGCKEGDYVTGEVSLEFPLCTPLHPRKPDGRWRVDKVSADLTPYVLDSLNRNYIRDVSQIRYEDVAGTDSVRARSYLLQYSELNPA